VSRPNGGIGRAALVTAMLGVTAVAASAQTGPAPSLRSHHVHVSGGLSWTGGYPVGDATATLRGNAVGASAPPFTLFRARTEVRSAPGAEVRVGVAVARGLTLELGGGFSRPPLATTLDQDPEASAIVLDDERLVQATVEIGATWQVPRVVLAGRARPFLSVGAGYLRQLYDDRTLVETGRVYSVGGGVRAFLRGGDGQRRALGVRAEARAQWRRDGVEFENRTRVMPVLGLQLFTEF
jgi:hypothetical protein